MHILGRRGTGQLSPRTVRRPSRDLSDSSCGSGSLSPTNNVTRIHITEDSISLATPKLSNSSISSSNNKGILSRCKSDQNTGGDMPLVVFDRDKLINSANIRNSVNNINNHNNNNGNHNNNMDASTTTTNTLDASRSIVVSNGRRMSLDPKLTANNV